MTKPGYGKAMRDLQLAQERKKEIEGIAGLGLSGIVLGLVLSIAGVVLGALFAVAWFWLAAPAAAMIGLGFVCYLHAHETVVVEAQHGEFGETTRIRRSRLQNARVHLAAAEQALEDAE